MTREHLTHRTKKMKNKKSKKNKSLKERLYSFKDAPSLDKTGLVGVIDEGLVYRVGDEIMVVDPEKFRGSI